MIWFTSDLHFFHKNVIVYCDRPFAWQKMIHGPELVRPSETVHALQLLGGISRDEAHWALIRYCQLDVEAMNQEMIRRWNERVQPQDTVYYLGDFSFGKMPRNAALMRPKLNGRIILIRGNHDRGPNTMRQCGFDEVHEELYLTLDGVRLYMAHHPTPVTTWGEGADVHLCGHVHDLWKTQAPAEGKRVINVGGDVWDLRPVQLQDLLAA